MPDVTWEGGSGVLMEAGAGDRAGVLRTGEGALGFLLGPEPEAGTGSGKPSVTEQGLALWGH